MGSSLVTKRGAVGASGCLTSTPETARCQVHGTKIVMSATQGGGALWYRRSDSNRHRLKVRGILSSMGEGDRKTQEYTTDHS